jgi:hypothetical protein
LTANPFGPNLEREVRRAGIGLRSQVFHPHRWKEVAQKLEYRAFQSMLKTISRDPSGPLGRLYHFTGDEDFLKHEVLKSLISVLVPPELKSFNLDLLYGTETSADQIIDRVSTVPVNAKRRLVVVFDLHKLSPFSKDMLLGFLPKLPDSTCLVFFSPRISKPTKFHKENLPSPWSSTSCLRIACRPGSRIG